MSKRNLIFIIFVLIIGLAACGDDVVQPYDLEADGNFAALAEPPLQEEPDEKEESPAEVISTEANDEETIEKASPEEIREILNNIPWAMVNIPDTGLQWFEQTIVDSETGKRIAIFIDWVYGWRSPPTASFHSPEEIIPDNVWHTSIFNTHQVQWLDDPTMPGAVHHPELSVLAPHLGPHIMNVWLHSHIEETARRIFGHEIKFPPRQSAGVLQSYNFAGAYVYSMVFGLGPAGYVRAVLSYECIGDGYEVVCVWVFWADGTLYSDHTQREEIPEDELLSYLQTTTNIHTITLRNNPDGGFYYWAHILPE